MNFKFVFISVLATALLIAVPAAAQSLQFKLTEDGVFRLEDGAHIPDNPGNRDWRQYQEWLADGNTPLPADPLPIPLTGTEIIDQTWQDNPFIRAMIKREARRGNKTVQDILDELKAELP